MTSIDEFMPNPARQAERIAEGLAILSLDLLRPVHACLDLRPLQPAALQPVLRQAIVENRAEFSRDPTVVPDLRRRAIGLVNARLGTDAAVALDHWLGSTFIGGPDDFRRHTYLQDVLTTKSAWPQLTIPDRLRAQFAKELAVKTARACCNTSYPDEDGALSEWDAEIYSRMRFYEEFRDPYDFIYLTCGWIDFRRALEWFVRNSVETEQAALCDSVGLIGPQTESAERVYEATTLGALVQRHA